MRQFWTVPIVSRGGKTMNLSLNFVKDYIDLDENLTVEEIAEAMTKAGSEYDSAEKLINATNLIIGEIKECEPHPDSDQVIFHLQNHHMKLM